MLTSLRRQYGAPISRRRVYILLLRDDIKNDRVKEEGLGKFIQSRLDEMKIPLGDVPSWSLCFNIGVVFHCGVVSLARLDPKGKPTASCKSSSCGS